MLVIELAGVLAGPSVGMFFAELGARVIKVEPPQGDVTRSWKLPVEPAEEDRPAYFCAANWGKQSITLDLNLNSDQHILHQMLAEADLLLMSFKPGDAARFGLEADFLASRYPKLLIGEITGYGADDPRVGYDAIIQAETGFTHLNGPEPGQGHKMPVALMDLLAAHQLKEGLLWALYEREKTKKGKIVRVSLAEAGAASLANMATNTLMGKMNPQAMGSEHPNIVPYGTQYRTLDGKSLVLAVGTDKQFALLAEYLGISTEGISSNAERVRKRTVVNALLAKAIAQHDRDSLLTALESLKVPAGAVRDLQEVLEQPFAWRLRLHEDGREGLRTAIFAEQRYLLPPPSLNQHGNWLREEWD